MRPHIPDFVVSKLKTIFQIPQSDAEPLPEFLVEYYYKLRQVCDSIGMPFGDLQIQQIAMHFVDKIPEKKRTFHDDLTDAGVRLGDLIQVKFRNKWHDARYCMLKPGVVVAAMLTDTTQKRREFTFDNCRLLEKTSAA